ncbi:MAG: proteasome accessory factor PafA2 family protein [Myxococcota bacterium]
MRERVFGIETEYALIYHPARSELGRPTNLQIYALFERALASRVGSLPRTLSLLRAKTGRFLENGMSFHYEATPEAYEHGLLEVASPECRDPLTLLHYERAKDDLVEELAEAVCSELRGAGFRGEVRVGKNNVDARGHTFGSHENYWVEDRVPPLRRLLLLLLWIPLWLVTLPVLAWIVAITPALLVLSVLAVLLYAGVAVAVALSRAVLGLLRPTWGSRLARAAAQGHRTVLARVRAIAASPGRLVRRLNLLVLPLLPLLELHSLLLRRFTLTRIQREFTAFLVTRTLYTGAGAVVFDGGPLLRLAQRPPFLRSLARIFTSGDWRPIYEIRDSFFRPWEVLGSRRRLHLMIPDANLCEWAQWLRVGVSALVLEAIEADGERAWPRLAEPLAALQELNDDAELGARLRLEDGGTATALEIQQHYLRGVREVLFRAGTLGGWKGRVLEAWQSTLALLAEDPDALADRVDWIAKRRLLRRELSRVEDPQALRRHGATLLAGTRPDDEEERRLRDLAFRLRRTDLRYHELGSRGGYRRLRQRGEVVLLADDDEVTRARRQPPRDTRASSRGRAIADACARRLPGAATWHRVRVGAFRWRFFLDPLDPGAGGSPG